MTSTFRSSRAAALSLAALLALAGPLAAQGLSPEERARLAAESIVQAERDFAAHVARTDGKTAFLAVLAEESVLFGPNAVDGRRRMEAMSAFPGWLQWSPAFAEVSPDGSAGYTTGPYTLTLDEGGVEHGRYLSIWRGEGGANWELVLDIGVAAPAVEVDEPVLLSHRLETLGTPIAANSVREADGIYAARVRAEGTDAALADFAGHRALVLRDGRAARRGVMDLDRRPIGDRVVAETTTEGAGCSDDAVLCWLWGRWRSPGMEGDGNWVRIWRMHRDGGYALVLDLRTGG